MHDDTQPARVYEMARALSYGQFPVRMVSDLGYGYGYPLFNFYAPLPYYVGAIFNLSGFDAIVSTKLMFLVGIVLSGVTMFFLIWKAVGSFAGLVCAVLYMYAPYHAVNIYVRGAVGEYYAYGFIPLFVLGIYTIMVWSNNHTKVAGGPINKLRLVVFEKELKFGIVLGSIGFSGILLSHNILGMIIAYIMFGLILIYFITSYIRRTAKLKLFLLTVTVCLGIGLSSFFILPAGLESKYTRVPSLIERGSDFRNHFVYIDQLWDSPWGYGGSAPGREDGLSYKIGKLYLIFGTTALLLLLFDFRRKTVSRVYALLYFSFIVTATSSVYLMLESSKTIWGIIPGFSFIQYPWRFLNITIFSLVVVTSYIFKFFRSSYITAIGAAMVIATLLYNVKYFKPSEYLPLIPDDYTSGINLRYKISKISDEYLPPELETPKSKNEVVWQGIPQEDGMKLDIISETPVFKRYQLKAEKQTEITTNIAYFPGWHARLDDHLVAVSDDNGHLKVSIPSGMHTLDIVLGNTPIRSVSNAISLFSFFLLVYVSLFSDKNCLWLKKHQ